MTLLYSAFASPAPDPEIVKRLKQIDERLDLRFFSYPSRDGANMNQSQNWAIIQRWRQDDKRRQMIMLGQMAEDADFDILAWLPVDCTVEQAHDYFTRACRGKFRDSKDIEYFLNNLHKWNKDAAVPQEVKDHAEEVIEANVNTMFKEHGKDIPKVFLAQGNLKKPK